MDTFYHFLFQTLAVQLLFYNTGGRNDEDIGLRVFDKIFSLEQLAVANYAIASYG